MFLLSIFLFFTNLSFTQSQNFILKNDLPEAILDIETEKIAMLSHNCHIKKNLGKHSNYIRVNLFPRIEKELNEILKPQIDLDGNIFFMGEGIDYGDIFHAHIRDPLSLISADYLGLHPNFIDPSQYHLQYHTYEYIDYLILNWVSQLRKVDNENLQKWLDQRQSYLDDLASQSSYSGSYGLMPSSNINLDALTASELNSYALAWNKSINGSPAMLSHLLKKLSYIDPKSTKKDTGLFSHRSVVTKNDSIYVIKTLNIKNYKQSATVYFEDLNDNPDIKAVIEEAKIKGFKYLINSKSKYFSKNAFINEKRLKEQQRLVDRIFEAAIQSSDPLYALKYAYEDEYNQSKHVLISWSENLIFSINYFIPCDKEDYDSFQLIKDTTTFDIEF